MAENSTRAYSSGLPYGRHMVEEEREEGTPELDDQKWRIYLVRKQRLYHQQA
ncbi:MAG: hypothetical protein HC782_05425 [Gammaproteobacteria bacterium]|nr:hypothetical protein [Gammaproteobacteria bacterium]